MQTFRNLKIVPVPAKQGRGHGLDVQVRGAQTWVGVRPQVQTRVEAIALRLYGHRRLTPTT